LTAFAVQVVRPGKVNRWVQPIRQPKNKVVPGGAARIWIDTAEIANRWQREHGESESVRLGAQPFG